MSNSGSLRHSSTVDGALAARVVTTTSISRPTTPVPPTTTAVPTTTTPPSTTTTDVGSLHQTDAFPTSASSQFQAEMAALWQGVVSGSSLTAQPAFFPKGAYLQLKNIADPASDYTERLLANFSADLDAAHTLLGQDPGSATLIAVNVPEQYGHWIPAGVCENSIGYFEVANSRVVYEQDGQVRSFGIASLISWRGEWYIVHMGSILRTSSQGSVEDPETGPGSSVNSTTC